ncbi:MAG: hypothetical protein ACK58L_05815, partial [Planctomycetota bacterium]
SRIVLRRPDLALLRNHRLGYQVTDGLLVVHLSNGPDLLRLGAIPSIEVWANRSRRDGAQSSELIEVE